MTPPAGIGKALRHYGAFVLAGTLAFMTDALVLLALIQLAGIGPLLARPFAIAAAMVVSYTLNRTITFRLPGPPSRSEFARFVGWASAAAALNYAVFAAALLIDPRMPPLAALVISSLASLLFAYCYMRFAVFTKSRAQGLLDP